MDEISKYLSSPQVGTTKANKPEQSAACSAACLAFRLVLCSVGYLAACSAVCSDFGSAACSLAEGEGEGEGEVEGECE